MTDEERKAIEQRVTFIDARVFCSSKTGSIIIAEHISGNHNKKQVLHYLNLWYGILGDNKPQRAKDFVEEMICKSENKTPGIYISPQKQEWLKEWLKDLSKTNSTTTNNESTFKDRILTENKDYILAAIHPMIDGKGGKTLALIIEGLRKEGIIDLPTFSEIKNEFKIKHSKQAYNSYIDKNYFKPQELESIKKAIRAAILSNKQ